MKTLVLFLLIGSANASSIQSSGFEPQFKIDEIQISNSSQLYTYQNCQADRFSFITNHAELSLADFKCENLFESAPNNFSYNMQNRFSFFKINGLEWYTCNLVNYSFVQGESLMILEC